jgi:hypothetical protein
MGAAPRNSGSKPNIIGNNNEALIGRTSTIVDLNQASQFNYGR